jgi:hypothetical protein
MLCLMNLYLGGQVVVRLRSDFMSKEYDFEESFRRVQKRLAAKDAINKAEMTKYAMEHPVGGEPPTKVEEYIEKEKKEKKSKGYR